ncbi:MAG: DegT/DnrJ/EryC1/StrS family aminotransferase [Desulfobacula sp.]|jgi:perosamine synthetase|nr:DegT/DnrJ/EryC1/StrS family aminotransferase [Desulfobacula sp.]
MNSMFQIPLIKPYINQKVKQKVLEVLDSGHLTQGPVTREFESVVGRYVGANHCIATTSCTTGLELALRAIGIKSGDEVIVPDYTYPATAAVVSILGAIPVLVDVDPHTMLINYDVLEEAITNATKAVIPVSLFGNPLDWDRLNEIKKKYNLYMVEDAACSLGSEFRGIKTGKLADITVFSLHPRKFITTGEGGLITTDNPKWADWIESYKYFGMGKAGPRQEVCFERIGTNYKMSDVNAAIGLAQMEDVEALLNHRQKVSIRYLEMLPGDLNVQIPETTRSGIHSYQTFCICIENRDKVMMAMRERGIEVQIGTFSLHMHPAFKKSKKCGWHGNLGGSRFAFKHCLALPLYSGMSQQTQEQVVTELGKRLRGMNP